MKKLLGMTLAMAAAAVLGMLLPSTGRATEPQPITFDFYFNQLDQTAGTAGGSFWTAGLFADQGTGVQTFRLTPPNAKGAQTVHGVKTLSGAAGDMVVKFNAQMNPPWAPPAPPVIVMLPDGRLGLVLMEGAGKFTIISGTEGYATLRGQGDVVVNLVLPIAADGTPIGPPVLTGTYTGQAHFEP